jgi:hypothetical protein
MNLNREQLRCFESPVKASIIAALRALGPSSARGLSQVTGNTTGSLYHHIRHLQKVGLLVVAETRAAETRPEAVYELAATEFFMRGAVGDHEYRTSIYKAAKNILRLAQRHYERALQDAREHPEVERAMRFNFVSARLSKDNLAKLTADMEALLLRALTTTDPDGEPVIFAGLLAPTGYREK